MGHSGLMRSVNTEHNLEYKMDLTINTWISEGRYYDDANDTLFIPRTWIVYAKSDPRSGLHILNPEEPKDTDEQTTISSSSSS